MKRKNITSLILIAIVGIFPALSSHASAGDFPRMHDVLILLKRAQQDNGDSSNADKTPGLLDAALQLLQEAPDTDTGHHAEAIKLVQAALNDLTIDSQSAVEDINKAVEETRKAIVEMGGKLKDDENPPSEQGESSTPPATGDSADPFGTASPGTDQ
jgi:hypothetical protein